VSDAIQLGHEVTALFEAWFPPVFTVGMVVACAVVLWGLYPREPRR
jgi:hypothetical protein